MWPLIIPALGSVVSSAVAGGASAYGQAQANKANVRLSREGMAFEAGQVEKQMAFQERMSSSSYQRATEDMRLAGINPMLAYAQGGASTPGGGAASGAAATVQDVVGPAVASAQHARRLSKELTLMDQQRTLNYTLQRKEANLADEARARTKLYGAQTAQSRRESLESMLRSKLHLADLPARRVSGAVGGGRFGTATEYVRRGLGALSPAAAAAAGIYGGAALGRFRSATRRMQIGSAPGQADVTPLSFDQPWLNRR